VPSTPTRLSGSGVSSHLRRLVDFAEPVGTDVCLDLSCGTGPVAAALGPRVRHVTAVDASRMERPASTGPDGRTPTVLFRAQPHTGDPDTPTVRATSTALPYRDGTFSLVTSRFALRNLGDTARTMHEMLRVCRPGGRVVIAEVVRPNRAAAERDRLERMRDPGHPGIPSVGRLTELIAAAGGQVRRLDLFAIERPVEPWLAESPHPGGADRIRGALLREVDGGPRTGAGPRVIGGELWFTQNWAHIAAEPARRGGRA
jgi:SAM-dependent methyltransferase